MLGWTETRPSSHTFAKIRDNFPVRAKVWTGRVSLLHPSSSTVFFFLNLSSSLVKRILLVTEIKKGRAKTVEEERMEGRT